jgi:hypothetical protein
MPAVPVQQSPFPPLPMHQTQGNHALGQAPMNSYNSPALQMLQVITMPLQQSSMSPIPMQQAPMYTHVKAISMPMQQSSMSPIPMQQAPMYTAHLGAAFHSRPDAYSDDATKKKELLQAPSNGQIKTFQQRAWSSKEFQIELHERVAEMSLDEQLDETKKRNLYHLIQQRDHDIIKAIIGIATIDDKETRTDEESEKREKMLTTLMEKSEKEPLKTGVKPFLSARLPFKRTSRKRTAHILQVPGTGDEEDIFNVQLVRYFVENVWKLERPDVIISVTGGASKNFDLRPEDNEKLMRGMMEGTRKLKTWSVRLYFFFLRLWLLRRACVRAAFLSARACTCKRLNTVSQISTRTQMSHSCAHTPAHAGL